jgi:Holliday junction resolvase RusA-like endonuclease
VPAELQDGLVGAPDAITFVVVGLPAPQGSKRHVGNGVMVESSKAVKPWRQDVKHAALLKVPNGWDRSGAMALTVSFRFRRPKGHYGTRGLKPSAPVWNVSGRCGDLSKLVRATEDALTGVVWDDDRQVTTTAACKRWCIGEEPAGAVITVVRLRGRV